MEAIAQTARQIIEQAKRGQAPGMNGWAPPTVSDDVLQGAETFVQKHGEKTIPKQYLEQAETTLTGKRPVLATQKPSSPQQKIYKPSGQYLIFVSLTMPQAELKGILEEASANGEDTVVILRGVAQGKTIDAIPATLAPLVKGWNNPPNVIIDPTKFKDHNITEVPAIAYAREAGQKALVARGIANVQWMGQQAKKYAGAGGDLGKFGTVFPISEPDLVEEMKRRVLNIDWAAQKENAKKRYWHNTSFVDLPTAATTSAFTFDPSIIMQRDMRSADGTVLVKAGQKINPLDTVPLTKTYVVIDGTQKSHLAVAKAIKAKAVKENRVVRFITTRVDRENGWNSLVDIENAVGDKVYLLQKDLAERFRLRAVPAMVEAKGNKMQVSEFDPRDFQ